MPRYGRIGVSAEAAVGVGKIRATPSGIPEAQPILRDLLVAFRWEA